MIQVLKVPAAAELHSVLSSHLDKQVSQPTDDASSFTSNLIQFKFNKVAIKVEAKCQDATGAIGRKVKA